MIGNNIEIEPCVIREQREAWHYNNLKTTNLKRYSAPPRVSQKG